MELRVVSGRTSRRAGHDAGYSPTPHPLGHRLPGLGESWHGIAFLAMFVVVFGITGVVLLVIATVNDAFPLLIVVAVLTPIIVLLTVMFSKLVRVRRAWQPSRLILSDWPLLLGGTTRAWFARPPSGAGATPPPASARLVLRESATYDVGTSTRTATHDVRTIPLGFTPAEVDGTGGFWLELRIPADGAPTIQLGSNLVEWIVEVDLESTGRPSTTSRFTVLVAPRLARGGSA